MRTAEERAPRQAHCIERASPQQELTRALLVARQVGEAQAFVGGEIHLMPIDQLRQRGILERVLRRETVHALVDTDLAQRPRWVRDGMSLYYSDPQIGEGVEVRGPCPGDLELEQPVSAGALANAYARARACVARQMSGGRSWRDVR